MVFVIFEVEFDACIGRECVIAVGHSNQIALSALPPVGLYVGDTQVAAVYWSGGDCYGVRLGGRDFPGGTRAAADAALVAAQRGLAVATAPLGLEWRWETKRGALDAG